MIYEVSMRRSLVISIAVAFISSDIPQGIESIDHEIELLTTQLHQLRMKSMHEDIHGQKYMLEQWGEFATQTEKAEKSSQNAHKIEKKLRELTIQRELLLNQQTSSPKSF
jgi:hypothetical protein